MFDRFRFLLLTSFLLVLPAQADHVIVSGGPTLSKWEHLRVPEDRHDRWWGNYVRGATLRMAEVRTAYGKDAPLVWMVYQPGYISRGREDGKPYTSWIAEQAAKRRCTLIWFSSSAEFLQKLNARPRGSIETFDFFGHSNRHAFFFDYSNHIMGASTAWLHERDLPRVKSSIFSRNSYCKSWGCHTGESMTAVWKRTIGVPLEGARGPTTYANIGQGTMPVGRGGWVR